jgi:4-amino-4-deoxy-L-arabinose transferase-like glycosyltransferase
MSKYSLTERCEGIAFQSEPTQLSKWEKSLGMGLLSLGLLLRIVFDFRFRFNSDEPQHLHVAWAWAHGLMQYRDVFDNHTPLFHLLCAPLVAWFGDRPDLLIMMRLAMLPVWGATLWATYLIGRALWGRRLGWWAAVLTALMPPFFTHSVEFRADDLWALLWVLFVAILISGRTRPLRNFFAGVVMGAAFGVSMKSSLLLAALLLGSLSAATMCPAKLYRPGWVRRLVTNLGAGIAGGILIPAALVIWFYSKGAFAPFYYGVIQHNMLPGLGRSSIAWLHWLFIPALIIAWALARELIVRRNSPGPQTTRRAIVFLTLTIYLAALETLWPLVTKQDRIPMWPLLMVFLAPLLYRPLPDRLSAVFSRRVLRPSPIPVLLLSAALCGAIWLTVNIPWRNRTAWNVEIWKAVLNLTNPDDYVMDLKGELIFRRRAVYPVFEKITNARIARGLINPQVARHLIETRTCVIGGFPQTDLSFLTENYVSVGPLFVVGKILTSRSPDPTRPISFEVVIPAWYRIVTPLGPAEGELDGLPCRGARYLSPGRHEFRPSPGQGQSALVWARAVEKGFSPFTAQGKTL